MSGSPEPKGGNPIERFPSRSKNQLNLKHNPRNTGIDGLARLGNDQPMQLSISELAHHGPKPWEEEDE
jgi:hypothetical protein